MDGSVPSYLSSHSADVFLSEVRPIKLKIEALRSVNCFLDEFLFKLLSSSCSLSTDRLRASLLTLLPTTLGKEALLEAEVELRAYWERTGRENSNSIVIEDPSKTFQIQWFHRLLRLKCEAYTTLNEADDDPFAEKQILTLMQSAGCPPPKQALVAPASLYLTAILEALCEHIISNVGRVVARDSSRNSATVQDLFTALCEDQSIYSLFRSLKVYEEIEHLSKATKLRKSKSLTRSDRIHEGSPFHDTLITNDDSPSRSRVSFEGDGATSRSSAEKYNPVKLLNHSRRSSVERECDGHNPDRRSESVSNNHINRNGTLRINDESSLLVDKELQREFDDLMRSSATVKMSLTPDRLKSMEVYKQEKGRRGERHPTSLQANSDPASAPPRVSSRRPSLLGVGPIKEVEEESTVKAQSPARSHRPSSISTQGPTLSGNRARSSSATSRIFGREPFARPPPPAFMQPTRHVLPQDSCTNRPINGRCNRESLDLDDVMAASDDDLSPSKPFRSLAGSSRRNWQPAVSAGTRELMNFLAEGPPKITIPVTDHVSEGSSESGKSKRSGRLQKMISKLSLSNGDRSKSINDDISRSKSAQTPTRRTLSNRTSVNNLSSLVNRSVPPRPPPPFSPSSSPSTGASQITMRPIPPRPVLPFSPSSSPTPDSAHNTARRISRSRSGSLKQHKQTISDFSTSEPLPPLPRGISEIISSQREGDVGNESSDLQAGDARVETSSLKSLTKHRSEDKLETPLRSASAYHPYPANPLSHDKLSRQSSIKVPTGNDKLIEPHLSASDAQELRRLFSVANNVDECRLVFDMFLAKSGILAVEGTAEVSTVVEHRIDPLGNDLLEKVLVSFLLGGDNVKDGNLDTVNWEPENKPIVPHLEDKLIP